MKAFSFAVGTLGAGSAKNTAPENAGTPPQ